MLCVQMVIGYQLCIPQCYLIENFNSRVQQHPPNNTCLEISIWKAKKNPTAMLGLYFFLDRE